MTFEHIQNQILEFNSLGKRMFVTSSFQTHSVVLLHVLSRIDPSIPVFFVNTGFLFPETIRYKNTIAQEFGINIIEIQSALPKSQQIDRAGDLLFASDPDYCCYLNKVQPLEPIIAEHDVWINGVRADQTEVRKAMKTIEQSKFGTLRYHPMLDWSKKEIFQYIKAYNLPRHPLDDSGYMSIGCEPCTRKMVLGDERSARWYGLNKTECGLNTELVKK
jgi:phosphoadenosine phosphosulfate reductase